MLELAHMPSISRLAERGATFEACYAAYRERIYRWCLRYGGGDAGWAEDVTHDVFVKLIEHLPDLENPEDLGGWLYRVTANLSLKRLRRDQSVVGWLRRAYAAAPERAPAPDALFEGHEQAASAMATLRALPPRERMVICLKVLDGKSQREIAEALSMSEGYVSKLAARAWARIRASGWEVDDDPV